MSYGANVLSKETIIENYIASVNFNDPRLDLNKIERDLSAVLHEKPAIKLSWRNERTVNELSGKESVLEKVASVKIYYTTYDSEGKIAPKSLIFYI
jgi:hypothetical protein